jgi:hypothetical protein
MARRNKGPGIGHARERRMMKMSSSPQGINGKQSKRGERGEMRSVFIYWPENYY